MSTPITVSSFDFDRLDRVIQNAGRHAGGQVAALEAELLRADVVSPLAVPPDLVTMNSMVRFAFEPEPEEYVYTLSYPWDADKIDVARLSVLTPVGCALLGLHAGQTIQWQVPGGHALRLRVIEVVWQPERVGLDLGA